MDIDKEIIRNTKCKIQFACMNDNDHLCCKVDRCVNQKVHFINYEKKNTCCNAIDFGGSKICTCQIRIEMYNKYNK